MSGYHWETVSDAALEETYYRCKHPSGLEIQVCPKPGYSSAYAVFSTKYGSIDTNIVHADGSVTKIPEGTAHFLEHKLFESEEQDAFERFSKTGASANAYTSFDKTAYEFTCSAHFEENLEILLDFVQSPYFTQATVDKEQGIIGQEIRMGLDSPGREVFYGLMGLLYPGQPVSIEIAGTEESIAKITAQLLYDCYAHYYNLHNMVLCVAGNVTLEQVAAVADRLLKPAQGELARRKPLREESFPSAATARKAMEVTIPTFTLGCKEAMRDCELSIEEMTLADLVLDVLAGEASPLYEQLLGEGLIGAGFSSGLFSGWCYSCALFEGESKRPELAARRIQDVMLQAANEGLDAEAFERARRKAYGRLLMACNDIDDTANGMADAFFSGDDYYARARVLREATLEAANRRAGELFRPENFALSIIEPIKR
ncbi:MAG: insulinase family protein [Oscillospiraceae bacterium]|nr:insulinase family protein [Oscillospiraceae bacterium]